jgi:hypothetical protein
MVALASVASSQSQQEVGETLPPASITPPTAPAAKPDASAKPDAKKTESSADYLAQCLRDWDAATHMTRQQWARTCRRVVSNRIKFMSEQQGK